MKCFFGGLVALALLISPMAASAQTAPAAPSPGAQQTVPSIPAAGPQTTPIVPPIAAPPPPPPQTLTTLADGTVAPVFGTQLFTGAFSAARPTKASDYLIQPGDQIAVRIYGAINVDAVQTVDTSGTLFIQGIGPVSVGGTPASSLQSRLTTALRSVYTNTVGVYVDVLQGGTLGVFVTGDVARPGRYLGTTGDSVLYFLDQAGGIDPARGSYRNIVVSRGGQAIAVFDLYDFILQGRIGAFTFKDGDVILVAQRGAMIGVTGDAVDPYAFEARPGTSTLTGAEILALARPDATVTSIGVSGVHNGLGQSTMYAPPEFSRVRLVEGDHVILRSDSFTQSISVTIQGDLKGPSLYVLPRGARLSQLLAMVPLDGSDVEPTYVHIERPSVALQQKVALNAALDDLEKTALTTPTTSTEAAAIASQQAAQLELFIARARQAVPTGKVAVYTDGRLNDIQLEAGDRVIFPKRTDVVLVEGQIVSPGAFAYARGFTIKQYVNRAGGFSPNANKSRFALRRPDGSALVAKASDRPRPGDEIVVVPRVINPNFLLFRDLTTIIFQLATTVAAIHNVTQ